MIRASLVSFGGYGSLMPSQPATGRENVRRGGTAGKAVAMLRQRTGFDGRRTHRQAVDDSYFRRREVAMWSSVVPTIMARRDESFTPTPLGEYIVMRPTAPGRHLGIAAEATQRLASRMRRDF